ncbi:MAG: STAS domain-containing protein [Gammaproteobacteria bacterium]|nr:STAS domain-containing protein [Gammaproteobacteria bacterium]
MAITSSVSDDGREIRIRIDGRFDFSDHENFRAAYRDVDTSKVAFRIDMSRTEYIDSAALGMLLLLRERAGGDGSRISISGCQTDVRRILEVSRFHQLFDIGGNNTTASVSR